MRFLSLSLITTSLLSFVTAEPARCGADARLSCSTALNPCCSQYGFCGAGGYCLGGCDPRFSQKPAACMPAPVCRSGSWKFTNQLGPRIASGATYLGDSSRFDWTVGYGGEFAFQDDYALLKMDPQTSRYGTVLSSTNYVWYGNVKATLKTARGAGVVTAFILMSDVKDEVDFEWLGYDLGRTETNFYWQGEKKYDKLQADEGSFNTFTDWHTYEIDWTPSQITWKIDNRPFRTLQKSDTFDATTGVYKYPQTPSLVQFSIWAGGGDTASKGTAAWAGGRIDWVNHPDIKNPGYYYAKIKQVDITCYDAPAGTKLLGSVQKSYAYDDIMRGLQDSVVITDRNTVLKSSVASGLQQNMGIEQISKEDLEKVDYIPGIDETNAGNQMAKAGPHGEGAQGENGNGAFSRGGAERVKAGSVVAVLAAGAAVLLV
ncbi:cell wall glucanase [Pyronema omphalodes]|nr:cell wall glucanase [Pyronema omphalodes]